MDKLLDLATIAAIRDTVRRYTANAEATQRSIDALKDEATEGSSWVEGDLEGDRNTFSRVAAQLEQVADEAAHYRAFSTARWLTGPMNVLPKRQVEQIIATIHTTEPVLEHRSAKLQDGEGDYRYRVRLVNFYDAYLEGWRWAVDYHDGRGGSGTSDNAEREDAEFRYWMIAEAMGAVRK